MVGEGCYGTLLDVIARMVYFFVFFFIWGCARSSVAIASGDCSAEQWKETPMMSLPTFDAEPLFSLSGRPSIQTNSFGQIENSFLSGPFHPIKLLSFFFEERSLIIQFWWLTIFFFLSFLGSGSFPRVTSLHGTAGAGTTRRHNHHAQASRSARGSQASGKGSNQPK